jgi:hypothetical protein
VKKVDLPNGGNATVGSGPYLQVRPGTNARIAIKSGSQLVRISGTGFPPSTPLNIIVSPGIQFANGLPRMLTVVTKSDVAGQFIETVTIIDRAPRNLVYVAVGDQVLASGEFR